MKENANDKVYFIGAGPGDVELLTLKARRLIECADIILYAGSLVNLAILQFAGADCEKIDSAHMKLETQIEKMVAGARAGKLVLRVHTGDPSIFGAVDEQIQVLERAGISYEIIPGVSSAFAAAAALGIEYTLPEIVQTLILTRAGGRTPVPEPERLRELARHHCSLAIFLSTGLIETVVEELLAAGYQVETPIAVVYRASWPDQLVVRGTLADISNKIAQLELTHQSLIIVSPSLRSERSSRSHLYGDFQQTETARTGTAILALTAPAIGLGRRLFHQLPEAYLYIPERFLSEEDGNEARIHGFHEAIRQVLQRAFQQHASLVCIMASGIVVRELAPLLENKHSDPAVVVLDAAGRFAVSLLSGHEGGANRLARQIAAITGGQAVITTASDSQDLPALDILAKENGWKMHPKSQFAKVMAALVNCEPVALIADEGLIIPDEIANISGLTEFLHWEEAVSSGCKHLLLLTCRRIPFNFWKTAPGSVVYHLPVLAVGIGCNRGTSSEEIIKSVQDTLRKVGLAEESVYCAATILDKANEAGLIEACKLSDWEMRVFNRDQIREVENLPNPSVNAFKALGVMGVAEPAALIASGAKRLLVEKQKYANVTVAVARKEQA
jgi:precorrin-4 C11-methyltransferase